MTSPATTPAPEPGLPASSIAAAIAAILLAGLAAAVWARAKRRDPAEEAFMAIARYHGLSRAERLLVRELAAAHGRATATALLISPHALREAVAAAQRVEDPERLEALVRKLDESSRRVAA